MSPMEICEIRELYSYFFFTFSFYTGKNREVLPEFPELPQTCYWQSGLGGGENDD